MPRIVAPAAGHGLKREDISFVRWTISLHRPLNIRRIALTPSKLPAWLKLMTESCQRWLDDLKTTLSYEEKLESRARIKAA